MTTPSFSTGLLKPLFSIPSPEYIYFPTLEWKLECVPAQADHPLLTLGQQGPPRLSPAPGARGPSPAAAPMGAGDGCPAGRQVCRGSGRTDRQTVWDGQAPLAVAELLLSGPGSLAHPGLHLLSGMSLLPQPARAGLLCLRGSWRNMDLLRGKETAVQLIQNNDILQNRHILHILWAIYNICTCKCGGLEGIFLLNDQRFLPPWQQLLARHISAHGQGWASPTTLGSTFSSLNKENPLFHVGAECSFPFQSLWGWPSGVQALDLVHHLPGLGPRTDVVAALPAALLPAAHPPPLHCQERVHSIHCHGQETKHLPGAHRVVTDKFWKQGEK